jgi:hypothetical protein
VRYLLMLCSDFDYQADISEAVIAGCGGWTEEMQRRGVLIEANGLRPATDATTVRVRADQVLLTDGPFAETKDQIGGYCLLECDSLDEVLELVAAHPWAQVGQIEVRPLWPS